MKITNNTEKLLKCFIDDDVQKIEFQESSENLPLKKEGRFIRGGGHTVV